MSEGHDAISSSEISEDIDDDFEDFEGQSLTLPPLPQVRMRNDPRLTIETRVATVKSTSDAGIRRRGRTEIATPRTKRQQQIAPRTWDSIIEEDQKDEASLVASFGDYQFGTILGKGSYGRVFKALNVANGQFCAIKEIPLTDMKVVSEELPRILKEIALLKELKHPNVVRYIDYNMVEDKCLHIVLEYVENGSLKDIVKKFSNFPEPLTARYCYQVLQGLEYLHDLDILHRDIKGANILITKEGVCKLADFGVATKLSIGEGNTQDAYAAGTIYWMAPEIFDMKEASKAADVWSFGCTVLELLTGSPPYKSLPKEQAICKIVENDKPPYPPHISADLENFLDMCFQKEPEQRATIKQLIEHPWITHNIRPRRQFDPNESIENLVDLFSCFDLVPDQANLGRNHRLLPERELVTLVDDHASEVLQKIQIKKQKEEWINPYELDVDVVRTKFLEMQEENALLLKIAENLSERKQGKLSEDKRRDFNAKRITHLEDSYAAINSDLKLAKLIYGRSLPISRFANGIRGVLLLKRAVPPAPKTATKGAQPQGFVNTKHKWKKRWILLQDNFLLCYKANEIAQEPVLVLRIHNPKILPIAERDIGKKFCFQMTVGKKSYYFAAANPQVLLKWLNVLAEATPWHQAEDESICYSSDDETIPKSDSAHSLSDYDAERRAIKRSRSSLTNAEEMPFPGVRLFIDETRELKKETSTLRKIMQSPGRKYSLTHNKKSADSVSPR